MIVVQMGRLHEYVHIAVFCCLLGMQNVRPSSHDDHPSIAAVTMLEFSVICDTLLNS